MAKPDTNMILLANRFGKKAVAVDHCDKKAKEGCFLLYDYSDSSYSFPYKVVASAVSFINTLWIKMFIPAMCIR